MLYNYVNQHKLWTEAHLSPTITVFRDAKVSPEFVEFYEVTIIRTKRRMKKVKNFHSGNGLSLLKSTGPNKIQLARPFACLPSSAPSL